MTDLVERLKACPFCAGDEISHGWQDVGGGEQGVVQCHSCGAAILADDETQAIAAWNRRPEPSPAPVGEWREAVAPFLALSRDWQGNDSAVFCGLPLRHWRKLEALGKADQISALGREGEQGTSHSQPVLVSNDQPEAEPSAAWQDLRSMPRDGTWFEARTACGQTRRVHYADKFDRLPIGDDGDMWNTLPVEWRPGAQPVARSEAGTTERQPSPRDEQNPPRNLEREG